MQAGLALLVGRQVLAVEVAAAAVVLTRAVRLHMAAVAAAVVVVALEVHQYMAVQAEIPIFPERLQAAVADEHPLALAAN